MITILHVLEDLGTGGSERQLVSLVVRSDRAQFRHEVCALMDGGPQAEILRAAGIPIHVLGFGSGEIWPVAVRLARLVRQVRPDVVHASLFRPGVVSRLVGRLTGRPVVTTLVNTTYEPEWFLDNPRLSVPKARLARALERMTMGMGAWFIAVSESVKASAVRQLAVAPDRVTVIPRGIEFGTYGGEALDSSGRAMLNLGNAFPVMLNVGRLVPQKGQRYAIQAMADIVSRYPKARLLVAGDGWLRPDLQQLIHSSGLSQHVTLLGDRSDVARLLRLADIFVFPSLFEGAANALLEAMAAGKPCVATRIPSIAEAARDGEAAVLVELRSPQALSAAILRLAGDREAAQALGESARGWVRNRHDYSNVVSQHESLYMRLGARANSQAAPTA